MAGFICISNGVKIITLEFNLFNYVKHDTALKIVTCIRFFLIDVNNPSTEDSKRNFRSMMCCRNNINILKRISSLYKV